MTDRALAQDKERLELRSHVLTLREGEMEARLQDRDRTITELTGRVDLLTAMLRKEQTSRDAVARRLSAVEAKLSSVHQVKALVPNRTSRARRHKTVVKVPHRIKRPTKRKPAPARSRPHQPTASPSLR